MSDRLLLVPLDDAVVFPGMSLTLAVDVGEEERVLLVPRHGQEFATVGTVAEITDRVRLPGGARAVALQGLHRGVAGAAHTLPDGRLFVEVEEHRTKIEEAGMPEHAREQAEKELGRLERMGEQSAESSVIRTYLDWLIAVPWSKQSDERLEPEHAREVLDADHAGLDDVKKRIVEYIAVKKLRQERGISEDKRSGAILTLTGPPGTGTTSIGESIARATGREFVRMSLGGVRDEAEIRGHRRTYIGALA